MSATVAVTAPARRNPGRAARSKVKLEETEEHEEVDVKPKARAHTVKAGVKRVRKSVVTKVKAETEAGGSETTVVRASTSTTVVAAAPAPAAADPFIDEDGLIPAAIIVPSAPPRKKGAPRKKRGAAAAALGTDSFEPKAKKPRVKKDPADKTAKKPRAKPQPRSKLPPFEAALAGLCKKLGCDASRVNTANSDKERALAGRERAWEYKVDYIKLQKAERSMKQRMFLMGRQGREPGQLFENFEVAGTTGNVYTIRIQELPKCTCMDNAIRRETCKHILFVLVRVLALPLTSPLWYQESFTHADLSEIFYNAPATVIDASISAPARAVKAWEDLVNAEAGPSKGAAVPVGKRIDHGEDCPVCFEEMVEGKETKKEALVYDTGVGGCGKAMHVQCFEQWTAASRSNGAVLACVWCRHPWEFTATANGVTRKKIVGYVNVAAAAGIDPERDMTIYRRAINGELGRNPEPA